MESISFQKHWGAEFISADIVRFRVWADLAKEEGIWHDVLMLFNPFEGDVPFQIPQFGEGGWVLELSTAEEKTEGAIITETIDFVLAGRSIALFRRP